jgi:hypothetical protein
MEAPEPEVAPAIPAPLEAVHENVVPAVKLLNATEVVAPEQIVDTAGVAVAKGIGFTVITTETGVPLHPPDAGVIL